jgi:deoxyadenosine/deoxycytidine kinase
MLKRIEKRNRPFEQITYDPSLYDYYKELNSRYEKWYEDYNESPKMQIDGDKFDFIENPEAAKEVVAQVLVELKKISD